MSEQQDTTASDTRVADSPPANNPPADNAGDNDAGDRHSGVRMSRRTWTVVLSMLIVLVFGLVGTLVRVPYVSLGPGPTHDTLAEVEGEPIIGIDGAETYATGGQLRMTTVSVQDGVTLLGALGLWVSGDYALAPREIYYPPEKTDDEVKAENQRQFQTSQGDAVSAALLHLKRSGSELADDIDVSVVVQELFTDEADRVLDPGDELIEVNGEKVAEAQDVRDALSDTKPSDEVQLVFRDEGKTSAKDNQKAKVKLGQADDGREEGYIGLTAVEHPELDGLDVDIALEKVGGPSAGMIFALAIVDRLTPGELTGGKKVAGTGEISAAGAVGSIGGISFKLSAAREDGAEVFLVPAGNCAEAASSAPDGLRLVKVATLDDAVSALETLDAGGEPPSC